MKNVKTGTNLVGRKIKGSTKRAIQYLMVSGAIFAVMAVMTRFEQFKNPYAAFECVGVVGYPAEKEQLKIEEYNLELATANYKRYPDSPEALNILKQAMERYLEAKAAYEAYQETEAYQEYLRGLECNRILDETHKK